MALPSFFKLKRNVSKPAAPDPMADDAGPVQAARTRARRRLIGAVVLLAIGVIGFPMLFETQPRPLPGDIPIELPRRDGQPVPSAVLPREPAAAPDPPRTADAAPAAAASAVPTEAAASPPPAERKGGDDKPAAPPPAAAAAQQAPDAPPAGASSTAGESRAGRFVVQVGAYTDPGTLRDVRAKVEKLGLKTYTQSIETDAGKRTRVRVGPFATRQEAEGASGKLKAAGLPGNVLVL